MTDIESKAAEMVNSSKPPPLYFRLEEHITCVSVFL